MINKSICSKNFFYFSFFITYPVNEGVVPKLFLKFMRNLELSGHCSTTYLNFVAIFWMQPKASKQEMQLETCKLALHISSASYL